LREEVEIIGCFETGKFCIIAGRPVVQNEPMETLYATAAGSRDKKFFKKF
jgi:hypothetical protein